MSRACQAAALSAMLAMAGCASPATRILTSANGYHWHSARYVESCPVATASDCQDRADVLRRWYTALSEANDALQRGGKLPLQLDALERVEKESKQWQR